MFSIELNNAQRKEVRVKNVDKIKRYAEINMALLTGQDTTAYGKEVDEVVKFMSQLGARAAQNDETAKAEINTIVKIGIEPLLVKQMQVYQLLVIINLSVWMKLLLYIHGHMKVSMLIFRQRVQMYHC